MLNSVCCCPQLQKLCTLYAQRAIRGAGHDDYCALQEVLELLRWEIKLGLALAGCANVRQLTPACVRHISDMPLRSAL